MSPHLTDGELDADIDDSDVPTVAKPLVYLDQNQVNQIIAAYTAELTANGHHAQTINSVVDALKQATPIIASFAPGVGPLVGPGIVQLLNLIPKTIS